LNEKFEPAKTLWDWLDLLIVPAVLAAAGYLFTSSQNRATRRATDARARDVALQTYLDKMSELLIDGHLHEMDDEYDTMRIAARARTLAVLSQMDPLGKKTVLLFLREARLINRYDDLAPQGEREKDSVRRFLKTKKGRDVRYYAHYVGLRGADLSKADLKGAVLISASEKEPTP
jgi:hypothetical protein